MTEILQIKKFKKNENMINYISIKIQTRTGQILNMLILHLLYSRLIENI